MKIAFVGDSLTAGNDWQVFFPQHEIINLGINGYKTSDILKQLDKLIELNPDKIIMMMGINDLGNSISSISVLTNYRRILLELKEKIPTTELYIQSILPVNKLIFKNMNLRESEIIEINKKLPTLAQELNSEFINLFKLFKDKEGRLNKKFTPDGLHLNAEAYKVWVSELKNKI